MKMIFIFNIASLAALAGDPSVDLSSEEEAEVVVVTATRSPREQADHPVATEVIDREAIEASGARDVADLLETHPGVQVTRSFLGATLQIHGLGAEHALVLVDGQRVAGRTGDAVDLSRFPVDSIERIEIVKGPGSAPYGSDALAGVVNLITRRPEQPLEGRAHARGGHLGSSDAGLGVGWRGERWSGRLDGGHQREPAYDLDPSEPSTDGSASRQLHVDGRLDGKLATGMELGLRGGWSRRQREGVDTSTAGALFDRTNLTEEARFAVEPRLLTDARGGVRLMAGASLFRDQYLLDQRGGTALDDYQDTRETVAQAELQANRVHGDHHLVFGVDAIGEWLTTERLADGRGTRQRLAAFAQDEISLFDDGIALMPSARLDTDTAFGVWPTGRLAVRWRAHEDLSLRATVGTGYRAPTFREMYLRFENPSVGYRIEGNPDLQPERSVHTSVSGDAQLSRALGFAVSAWWDELSDLIAVGTLHEGGPGGPVRYGYLNVDSARARGGEASLRLRPGAALDLQASFAYTDTLDRARGGPLEGRARLQGTLSATALTRDERTRATVRANFTGPRPFYLADEQGHEQRVEASPYLLAHLRLEHRRGPVSFAVGVENLLDAGDSRFLAIPPRRFWAGVDARLPDPTRGGRR